MSTLESDVPLKMDESEAVVGVEAKILARLRLLVGPSHDLYFTSPDPDTLRRYVVVDGHRLTPRWTLETGELLQATLTVDGVSEAIHACIREHWEVERDAR